MFWKILFQCESVYASILSDALEPHVLSVAYFKTKDPHFWTIEGITTTQPREQDILQTLKPACALLGIAIPCITIEELPDTDWLETTWRNFPPRQIGQYYIYGSHTSPHPPKGSVMLEINAATAFGSGEHETTTGCLLILNDLAIQGQRFQKPLDMGCGSGILGIAIAKTWNVSVVAADDDSESIKVATHNAALNKCPSLLKAILSSGFNNSEVCTQGPYDLIVANILADPLIEMAPSLTQSLAPKGLIVLSGLLTHQAQEVAQAYAATGIQLLDRRTLNDWETMLLEKV